MSERPVASSPQHIRSGRGRAVLIVHGGAGANPTDALDEVRDGIRAAVSAGWQIITGGGTSLDAVEAAVRVLEDAPRFNAGRGSVRTSAGTVEMDASIMEGDELRCGAVAAVAHVANPVMLARRVLEDGRHVLLVADGARAFARAAGLLECDPASLITERRRLEMEGIATALKGTVGAVARDTRGTIAAATSTGGMTGKLPGRVGDTPLIGCGTYADSSLGGISCTGSGEGIIRVVLARRALDILKESDDPEFAAEAAVDLLVREGRGEGGVILLDRHGRLGYAQSTRFMPVGWMATDLAGPLVPF